MPAYQDEDGRWRYRFAYQGDRYSGSSPVGNNTKRAAEKLERQHIEKVMAGVYTGAMPTVAEFVARFLDYQKPPRTAPLTHEMQSSLFKLHVSPYWGTRKLDKIGAEAFAEIVTKWLESAEPSTVNVRLAIVRHMFALAVDWNILTRIPKFEYLEVGEATPRFLSDEEMYALVEAADPQWRTMIVVGLRTGLRIGELRGLQWGDVDFDRRVIQVRRTHPGKLKLEARTPKGKRERTVPLTDDAIAALLETRPAKYKQSGWVWTTRGGGARTEGGCRSAMVRFVERAGLTDVGWHTLRHTYASHLVMRGVPLRTVQTWLGHASIVMTEKYSHLAPAYGHDSANLLDTPLAAFRQHGTKRLSDVDEDPNYSARLPDDP